MTDIRILIVEDNPGHMYLTRRACELLASARNIPVTIAEAQDANAAKAHLQRLRSAKDAIELVILDLNLPDASGLDWLTWANEGTGLPVPAVVFSSSVAPADVVAAYRAGALGYLVKPADNVQSYTECVQGIVAFALSNVPARRLVNGC